MRAELQQGTGRAARLMEQFSGHKPTKAFTVVEKNPKVGFVIGDLEGVLYAAKRDGHREHYLHEFAAHSRPLLAASSDGRQLKIVGGRFQFTEAGIEDR